tara:strand:- start:239 stop:1330 length:1092 start_codon:yes stop_codon:yes gene_type:complete
MICKSNEEEVNGVCVAKCPAGQSRNASGVCTVPPVIVPPIDPATKLPTRNLAIETTDILTNSIPKLTDENVASQLRNNPQLTQNNASNFNTATGTIAGGMDAAYATANPNSARANQALEDARSTTNRGMRDTELAAHTSAATGIFGPKAVGSANSELQQAMEEQALEGLRQGRNLSPEEARNARQSVLETFSARGQVGSNAALAAEILNRDSVGRQREAERRAFAQQVAASQDASNRFNVTADQGGQMFNADAVNRMNTANTAQQNALRQYSAGLMSSENQAAFNNALQQRGSLQQQALDPFKYGQANVGMVPDYTGNALAYGQDVFNTDFNAVAASKLSDQNNSAAYNAALMKLLGSYVLKP